MPKGSHIQVGIVTAMPIEMSKFDAYRSDKKAVKIKQFEYQLGTIGNKSIVSIVAGIGQTNTAINTAALINNFELDYLFFSGIAGAINHELSVGSTLVAETVFNAELLSFHLNNRTCVFGELPPLKYMPDPALLNIAKSLANQHIDKINFGIIASSDYFPVPSYLPEKLEQRTIDAIDMESAAFSQACFMFDKPQIVIRNITNHINGTNLLKLEASVVNDSAEKAAHFVAQIINSLP